MWNGRERTIYHYSATLEFPYTVGCYRGTPVDAPKHDRTGNSQRGGRQRPVQGQNQGQVQEQGRGRGRGTGQGQQGREGH
ncbi:hypothetical protein [Streptomyces sp. NPDC059828]|uniref:hypothetical protein n=1 Tax=Streptomyces sp. NPDC059828 TaxID=3346965 RepID=UPI0036475232